MLWGDKLLLLEGQLRRFYCGIVKGRVFNQAFFEFFFEHLLAMLSDIVFVLFCDWLLGYAPTSSVLLNSKEGLINDVKPLLGLEVLVNTLQYVK